MGEVEGLIRLYGILAMLQLKPGSTRGVSHQTAYVGNCHSHVFSLMHLVDEFILKKTRTWGQSKISFCCVRVWCEQKELRGRRSTRFPTPMLESFSTDFVPALESYFTESRLEFCQTSTTELFNESMRSTFR